MRDFLLDWESEANCAATRSADALNSLGELPEPEWSAAYKYAADADLTLCLGTSLQISPVGELPLISKRRGGKFASINLQPTKHVCKPLFTAQQKKCARSLVGAAR